MKFAMLGGSFNPIHNGHLKLAESVIKLGYDRVIFIPAYQSPLKPDGQGKQAEARVKMLFAAISGDRRFTVDLCEVKRGGLSYTVDTVGDVCARYTPEGFAGLVLGDDLIEKYSEWRGAAEIAVMADIIIARRIGDERPFSYRHKRMNNEVFELSSGELRESAASGGKWRHLLPEASARILEEYGLYGVKPVRRENKKPSAKTARDAEDYVRSALSLGRFSHSRNTALHCADLACRFGLDEQAAYIAGITHDVCKDMETGEMAALTSRDSEQLSPAERASPALLHGRAGAVFLRETMGVKDEAVLEAVRLHTTGKDFCGPLAKILYICDKIEAGREGVDNELRRLAFGPSPSCRLDELYSIVRDATRAYLSKKGIL
jgi:nicotinate-nucleotide adenylyltransferase